MTGLDNSHMPGWHPKAIARDHQPRERCLAWPGALHRYRHGGCRFAGTNHDSPSGWERREMGLDDPKRIGSPDCLVKTSLQEFANLHA